MKEHSPCLCVSLARGDESRMFTALLEKLMRHEDLTEDEAAGAMREVMDGRASPASLGALLSALVMKGERPAEVVGFARTMREHAVKLSRPSGDVFDTCGTGGDRAGTFNISSAAALVVAACGVKVAKHGNRSVSSRCGSADVFEQLGVNIAAPAPVVERSLHDANIGFFFAPTFHPSMKHAAQTRRELGIRTAFNLLGPLTNPAGARRQIVGVPRPELADLVARALLMLGSERAWVVHGVDGIDEISTTGYTKVLECRDGSVNAFYVHPAEFGIPKASPAELQGGDAAQNAAIVRDIVDGKTSAARNVVALNAGAALFVAGAAGSVREGIALAASAIDRGDAGATLDKMVRSSQKEAVA
jgi:anthranilate phosphoribosyltransferase